MARLLLLVQTYTNSKMRCFSFIPVVDNQSVLMWVKYFYKKMKVREEELLPNLYHDFTYVFRHLTDMEVNLFIDRLSGYKRYGMSIEQLGKKYNLEPQDVRLLLLGITHFILDIVLKNQDKLQLLPLIADNVNHEIMLSESSKKTYQFLLQGFSIDEITVKRKLKENTIYDHVVEIALLDREFPINDYVPANTEQSIIKAIKKTKSFKLRDIKNVVGPDVSFFQIRLVLAKYQFQLK